jgi:hypothetical protein
MSTNYIEIRLGPHAWSRRRRRRKLNIYFKILELTLLQVVLTLM